MSSQLQNKTNSLMLRGTPTVSMPVRMSLNESQLTLFLFTIYAICFVALFIFRADATFEPHVIELYSLSKSSAFNLTRSSSATVQRCLKDTGQGTFRAPCQSVSAVSWWYSSQEPFSQKQAFIAELLKLSRALCDRCLARLDS